MAAPSPTPVSASPRVSASPMLRAVRRSWWTWIVVAALVAGVFAIGAAGGWARVQPDGLARVPVGARVALGPYDAVVHEWTVTSEFASEDLSYIDDAAAWVLISADLTANPPRSTSYYGDTFAVQALTPVGFQDLYNRETSEFITVLHPGVTIPAVVAIPISQEEADVLDALDTLPVILSTMVWDQHTLSDEWGWWRPQPRAMLQVPRNDAIVELGADE